MTPNLNNKIKIVKLAINPIYHKMIKIMIKKMIKKMKKKMEKKMKTKMKKKIKKIYKIKSNKNYLKERKIQKK